MAYVIQFDRAECHATFHGYRTHGLDPYFDMARTLVTHRWPDAPAVFVDEHGTACVTVRSLHSCARRYRPTQAEESRQHERRAEKQRLEKV